MLWALSACSVPQRHLPTVRHLSPLDGFSFAGSPRTWAHHRDEPSGLAACSPGVEGMRLCVGDAGEVWIDVPPHAEVASQLLPDDLIDVWHDGVDWQTLGRQGAVYRLTKTAQAVDRVRQPPLSMQRVVRVGKTLLGVADGRLLESTDAGVSWRRQPDAPENAIDVAADGLGRVVLLATPEQLWHSTDGAHRFTRLRHENDGVTALSVAQERIRSVSLLRGTRAVLPQLTTDVSPKRTARLDNPIARYLASSDFLERRAAEWQNGYLVARHQNAAWLLYEGELGRPLQGPWPMQGIDCGRLALAALDSGILAFCSGTLSPELPQPVTLHFSKGRTQPFTQRGSQLFGVPDRIRILRASRPTRLFVTGLCPPSGDPLHPRARDGSDCHPRGILRLETDLGAARDADSAISFRSIAAPAISDPAEALAASASGDFAVAVARRAKTRRLALYVSNDGGRWFAARPLPEPLQDLNDSKTGTSLERIASLVRIDALSVSDAGSISLVARLGDHPRLYAFDAEGSLQSTADAPEGVSRLGAFEDYALALSVTQGTLYQTNDRGADFQPIATNLPRTCDHRDRCEVVCRRQGCLIGDELTQLGYWHRTAPMLELPAAPTQESDAAPARPSEWVAHCDASSGSEREFNSTVMLPDARCASLGSLAYRLLAILNDESNVQVIEVGRDGVEPVVRPLFARRALERNCAVAVQQHDAGWAASRLVGTSSLTPSTGRIEFAWFDVTPAAARKTSARIPGLSRIHAAAKANHAAARFEPGALIPMGERLFFQTSTESTNGQTTGYLVSANHPPTAVRFDGWGPLPVQHTRVLVVDDQVVPWAIAGTGMVLLRGSFFDPSIRATTIAPNPARFERGYRSPEFSLLSGRPGLVLQRSAGADGRSDRQWVELRNLEPFVGPGHDIPRLVGQDGLLAGCSKERRRSAQRLVVPVDSEDHLRFGILDRRGIETQLPARSAVLYVDVAGACWDSIEGSDEALGMSALVFADPGAPAWLFRNAKDRRGRDRFETSTMSCHFEASAEAQVPADPEDFP